MAALCSQCGRPSDTYAPDPSLTAQTPRFSALLASNEPPSDAEMQELKWRLHVTRDRRAAVDERIASLRAGLASALAEKDCLQEYEENAMNILCPSRRFPTEVLTQIFECYVSDVLQVSFRQLEEGSFVDSLDTSQGPWLLSHVSSGWRRVALSLPRIWTTVNLTFDRYKPNKRFSSAFLLAALLSHTSTHLLQINLHGTSGISDHPSLPIIVVTCPRWRTLQVSLARRPMLAILAFHFDSLESAHFHIMSSLPSDRSWPSNPDMLDAPRLQSVSVTNLVKVALQIGVPWQQLVSFHQVKPFDPDFVDMTHSDTILDSAILCLLREAPDLRSATIQVDNFQMPSQHDSGPVTCASLECLTLLGASGWDEIFLHFRFSRLRSLRFGRAEVGPQVLPKPLSHGLGDILEELAVSIGKDTGKDAFINLMRSVPNLTTLEAQCYPGNRLRALLSKDSGILPKLETLVVKGCPRVTMGLVSSVRDRRVAENGMVTLKKVVIHGDFDEREWEDTVHAAVREIVAGGCEFVILPDVIGKY